MAGAGRPKGRKDNPYNSRKGRSESDQQKQSRIDKAAATRRLNNAKKKAREQDTKSKSNENPLTRNFFAPRVTAASSESQQVPASQPKPVVATEGIGSSSKQASPDDEDFVVD